MMKQLNPVADDLDHILSQTTGLWDDLRGQNIFISGGTGFFGCWLLESLIWANDHYDLGVRACVLTRHPHAFHHKAPHLAAHPSIELWQGDVRSFDFPPGHFAYVIHAAAEADMGQHSAETVLDIIVQGTAHMLALAHRAETRAFLLTSSGAVYGRQPSDLPHISEAYIGAPVTTDPKSTYGEGKRMAELLCAIQHGIHGLSAKIARCFAFVGPYLPLDSRYAIGNFIRDSLHGGPVQVNGDGTPYRSYLYAADLAVWLWTILLRGETCQPYNVGSEYAISIGDLAHTVAAFCNPVPTVRIKQSPVAGAQPQRYVPSTQLAQDTLGLHQTIDLEEAIRRTIRYNRSSGS